MADAGLEMVPRCGHLPGRDDADDAEIRLNKKVVGFRRAGVTPAYKVGYESAEDSKV